MFVNNCFLVAVVARSSIDPTLTHFGLHLCHVLFHALLHIWVLVQHIVHKRLLEIFVLNVCLVEHAVMHFRLINHHLDHHVALTLSLLSGSCGQCLYVIESEFLLLREYLKRLRLVKFGLGSSRRRLTELSLLSSHYEFGGSRVGCHGLVSGAE